MNHVSARGVVVNGTRIRLRGLEESDLPLTLAWRNDDRSRRWFKSQEALQLESHVAWFARYAASKSRDCIFFAETLNGEPVGQSSIYNFDQDASRAEVGRFISDPELRGKGLFRDALIMTLIVGFDVLGLEELHLEVIETNARAIRLYESVGFIASAPESGLIAMRLSHEDFSCERNEITLVDGAVGEGAP